MHVATEAMARIKVRFRLAYFTKAFPKSFDEAIVIEWSSAQTE
jgi:hypothetical protein